MKELLFFALCFSSTSAAASDPVSLESEIFVERSVQREDKTEVVRQAPQLVTPGEKLVFVLKYSNMGASAAADFKITNPIPSSVAYATAETGGADVSVDGGKIWGSLASLTVRDASGEIRNATPADVTHVRWVFRKPIPAGTKGEVIFRGIVR